MSVCDCCTSVFIQRSSDLDGGMADENRYAGRKELRLHFFLFSDLILFARSTRELGLGWMGDAYIYIYIYIYRR